MTYQNFLYIFFLSGIATLFLEFSLLGFKFLANLLASTLTVAMELVMPLKKKRKTNKDFKKSKLMKRNIKIKKTILMGVSGGIDSAVGMLLLKKRGFDVKAVFFILNKNYKENLERAKKTSKILGIDFLKVDLRSEFKKEIVKYFIDSYQGNETPNPCVFCNQKIKFEFLYKLAKKNKIDYIATGHYANVMEENKEPYVSKATDLKKDQSYFLYRLSRKILKKIKFPLGNYEKKAIIKIAERSVLKNINFDKESQDICFFSKNESLRKFLKKSVVSNVGKIFDDKGGELGTHCGVIFYTIGQRRGLNLSGGPFFVVKKDRKNNILTVSKNKNHKSLRSKKIFFKEIFWVNEIPVFGRKYEVKIRYSTKSHDAHIEINKKGRWQIIFQENAWAIASGQSAVVYDGRRVLGGGIIEE